MASVSSMSRLGACWTVPQQSVFLRRVALVLATTTAFGWQAAAAKAELKSTSVPTPVSKVTELLGILQKQLHADSQADDKQHGEYVKWFQDQNSSVTTTITETTQDIESMKAQLEEEEARREGFRMALEKAVAEETTAQNDLKYSTQKRKTDKERFEKAEAELANGADQFKRAIEVLKKRAPPGSALLEDGSSKNAGAASEQSHRNQFLAVARQLRDTLEHSRDFSLTGSQRETLNGLFRIVETRSRGGAVVPMRSSDADTAEADDPTLSFVEVKARVQLHSKHGTSDSSDPYGEYESQTSGLLGTLKSVLDKTTEELETERENERGEREVYKMLKEELDRVITNKQAVIANLKMQTSQSEQKTGQLKSQMQASERLLKTSIDEAAQLNADHKVTTGNYNERSAKRADEQLAIQEALEILTSEKAQNVIASQFAIGSVVEVNHLHGAKHVEEDQLQSGEAAEDASPSFLQQQKTPFSLLATKSRVHRQGRRYRSSLRLADSEDPFSKVKNLIRSMLHKLTEAQTEDVKHGAWCDSEMAKSTKERESRKADVQKIKDRIEEMNSRLAELVDGIATTKKDMEDMKKASTEATALRKKESDHAISALAQYRDAQKIIKSALEVLKKFYEAEGNAEPSSSGFSANGAGSGIIGLLEVALSDYANLEEELSLNEKVAQRDYEDYMASDKTREAVLQKDLEYKEREKVRVDSEHVRASSDLKSYEKELEAVESYLAELKTSCTIKGDTYDERKERREKELAALKSALDFLRAESL